MAIGRRLVRLGLLASLLMTSGHAESGTSGGLQGIVTDADGRPVAGASVLATGRHPAVTSGSVTGPDGLFRIAPLPAGTTYEVRISLDGMATVVFPDVHIGSGTTTSLAVTLTPAETLRERVTAAAKPPVIEPGDVSRIARFDAEFVAILPILGRNYQDILTLAPGVTDEDGDGDPNIHGARETDVVTLVDGVSTVDPFTGRVGQQLNIESIREIEVRTSAATAEYGRAQGGFVNIVTKSGGNELEGSFKFFWRGSFLDRDGAGNDEPLLHGGSGDVTLGDLDFNDFKPFLSLGGPIVRDHAWFYGTAEFIQEEEPTNALSQIYVVRSRESRLFSKVNWDLGVTHRLVLTLTGDSREDTNQGLDVFTSVISGYSVQSGSRSALLKETSIFGPNAYLETAVQWLSSRPRLLPSLDPDTNGNGRLYVDGDGDGVLRPAERDPGDDWDDDGAWDVAEGYADLDGDGRVGGACEGDTREDHDCDGWLDNRPEDLNGNGRLDEGEDLDFDRRLDDGTEDHNGNHRLDDRPFPADDDAIFGRQEDGTLVLLPPAYPYPRLRPLPPDRDYTISTTRRGRHVTGPFFHDESGDRGRVTLRQDLTLFVPDWTGSHDLKFGGIAEKERYRLDSRRRPVIYPLPGRNPRTIDVEFASDATNRAAGLTLGVYAQDVYKPTPSLTLGLGLRFDREATESFGYSSFEPFEERRLYDRLIALGPGETTDATGNHDGTLSAGFCSDPLFRSLGCEKNSFGHPTLTALHGLSRAAIARMTQHHRASTFLADHLVALFPEATVIDELTGTAVIDTRLLDELGLATIQHREPFRLTNNNLAPRLFLSWDPTGDARTRVFLNWSRFYDKLFLQSVAQEEGPDTIFRSYVEDVDGVGAHGPNHGLGRGLSIAPASTTQVSRGLRTPFADEMTFGVERELAPEVGLKITWMKRAYRDQLQDRDVNHEVRRGPDGALLNLIGDDAQPDLYVGNFFFNQVLRIGNDNEARYTGIEVQVERRLRRRWQMLASYTYSRALGSAEEFVSTLGDDPSITQDEYGYLDYDQRHAVKVSAGFFLPRDWQIGAIGSWSSGWPYSLVYTFVAGDDFGYPQSRTFYGHLTRDGRFFSRRRNTERNESVLNIDLKAQKSLVWGRHTSKVFLSVQNLLNTDDLRVYSVARIDGNDSNTFLDSERRFGRRFELGFQVDF